ncbi:MAG: type VI secretion system baseplate subunit TssF, partial [Holosporales bacterium]|nr:type VI secretion system baseplate subunit TssF [Holosporales bacterium]
MKDFLNYYQEELLFLRKRGGSFAKKHPEIAGRLDVKDGESSDPHTERIIESVAFMSAKLNQKIDNDAQFLAFHLLSALYPNLVNPFPPCGVIRLDFLNNISKVDKVFLPKGTSMFTDAKLEYSCIFQTVYPINLYPIEITDISLMKTSRNVNGQCICLKIVTKSVPFEQMDIDDLLFHINSEIIEDALLLYEAIFSNPQNIMLLKIGENFEKIDTKDFIPCGFTDNETVCPVHKYTTNTFQLFQEALHFKRKFMFFRIRNLNKYINNMNVQNIDQISILIDINPSAEKLPEIVKFGSIIINAVPIVNLFKVTSDPFRFNGTKNKYLLIADQSRDRSVEIHSITDLKMIDSNTQETQTIQPYFSLAIDSDTNTIHDLFWVYTKESSEIRGLNGSDIYISLVDTNMNPEAVYSNIVYATT